MEGDHIDDDEALTADVANADRRNLMACVDQAFISGSSSTSASTSRSRREIERSMSEPVRGNLAR